MQRVSSTAMTLAALAALFLCAALWRSVAASQEFQAQQLAQQKELFEALRSRLSRAEDKPTSTPMEGWEQVVVVLKGEDGQPTTGKITLYNGDARVRSNGQFYEKSLEKPLEISPVEASPGRYDLGLLPHGKYQLAVSSDVRGAAMTQEVFVRSGASTFECICPTAVPPVTRVAVEVLPPDDLRNAPLKYEVQIYGDQAATLSGVRWRLSGSVEKPRYLIFNPDGQQAGELDGAQVRSPQQNGGAMPVWTTAMLRPAAPVEFHARQVQAMVYMNILIEKSQLLRFPNAQKLEPLPVGDQLQMATWFFEVSRQDVQSGLMRFTPDANGGVTIRFPQDHPLWAFIREKLATSAAVGYRGQFNDQGVFVPELPGSNPQPQPNQ